MQGRTRVPLCPLGPCITFSLTSHPFGVTTLLTLIEMFQVRLPGRASRRAYILLKEQEFQCPFQSIMVYHIFTSDAVRQHYTTCIDDSILHWRVV